MGPFVFRGPSQFLTMSLFLPKRPDLPIAEIQKVIDHRKPKTRVVWVGLRGYYADGQEGNKRGVYDDAMFVVRLNDVGQIAECYRFNGNTDPSVFRKGIAVLKPGNWLYKIGIHGLSKPANRRYRALVQAAAVTVVRDGKGEDTGWFGINGHRGGWNTTSSEGCQTVHPAQFGEFMRKVEHCLNVAGESFLTYVLMDEHDRRTYIQ